MKRRNTYLHFYLRCALAALLSGYLHAVSVEERAERLSWLREMWQRRQRDRLARNRTLFDWSPSTDSQTAARRRSAQNDFTDVSSNSLLATADRPLFDWSSAGRASGLPSSLREGDVRLSGGRGTHEGNVEIYHDGRWGYVCDDDWDIYDADVVCRQLGYMTALKPTHDGFYGHPRQALFWMDNTFCSGSELRLADCRSEGWGVNDCSSSEIAGVSCRSRHTEDNKSTEASSVFARDLIGKTNNWQGGRIQLRLRGGRNHREGRLELRTAYSSWGTVCGDGWGLLQANIACQTLGYGFAASALQTGQFGGEFTPKIVSGLTCVGNESSLVDCWHDKAVECPGDPSANLAAVVCEPFMADLVPNIELLVESAYLEDKQMFYLQCAMEENCLSPTAYQIKNEDTNWHLSPRRLLRFTTRVLNAGTADFRPFLPKQTWEWHACHMHYHSMEVFSTYDITDSAGRRMAEGHKASFCLEDSHCNAGVSPIYNCANFGDQGISVGCSDSYAHNIDCQWVDITGLPAGNYQLRVVINGEYKVGEQTWENNAVTCKFDYTGYSGSVSDCSLGRP